MRYSLIFEAQCDDQVVGYHEADSPPSAGQRIDSVDERKDHKPLLKSWTVLRVEGHQIFVCPYSGN